MVLSDVRISEEVVRGMLAIHKLRLETSISNTIMHILNDSSKALVPNQHTGYLDATV